VYKKHKKEKPFSKLQQEDKNWQERPIGRICFRGDTRPPVEFLRMPEVLYNPLYEVDPSISPLTIGNDYFKPVSDVGGFLPQRGGVPVYEHKTRPKRDDKDKVFRQHSKEKMEALKGDVIGAGDISEGGVCVTTDFYIAPLFPINAPTLFTWIYMVYVENGYDTHGRQCLDSLEVMRRMAKGDKALRRCQALQSATCGGQEKGEKFITEEDASGIMGTLYGQELVVTQIPCAHIIAAVRCWRDVPAMRRKEYNTVGIHYWLREEFWINPVCKAAADNGVFSAAVRDRALQFLIDESIQHPRGVTPCLSSGFAEKLV
jgi:hypothetical protein